MISRVFFWWGDYAFYIPYLEENTLQKTQDVRDFPVNQYQGLVHGADFKLS